jgi:hypothetical protein
MKGPPTNENTPEPERQYAAPHSARTESKKKTTENKTYIF